MPAVRGPEAVVVLMPALLEPEVGLLSMPALREQGAELVANLLAVGTEPVTEPLAYPLCIQYSEAPTVLCGTPGAFHCQPPS